MAIFTGIYCLLYYFLFEFTCPFIMRGKSTMHFQNGVFRLAIYSNKISLYADKVVYQLE